ncbi:MAG: putative membrane protein [Colwellia sp.]|jgi:uncharacterized membrane protein
MNVQQLTLIQPCLYSVLLCFSALTTYTLQAAEIKHPKKHFKRNKDSWLGCASLNILTNYFFPFNVALCY